MEERRDGVWCLAHEPTVRCEPAILRFEVPHGVISSPGLACPRCGVEWMSDAQTLDAEARLEAAGFFQGGVKAAGIARRRRRLGGGTLR